MLCFRCVIVFFLVGRYFTVQSGGAADLLTYIRRCVWKFHYLVVICPSKLCERPINLHVKEYFDSQIDEQKSSEF